jgi:hypothetical protein
MTVSADEVCRSGLPYPVAIEIARQMNAGVGNGSTDRLISTGMAPESAKALANQINAGSFDSHKLAVTGLGGTLATVLKRVSGL